MSTMLDSLRQYGANVEEGLARCIGKESFYLRLLKMFLSDPGIEKLGENLEAKDLKAAFETAHSIKGMAGNLSLTPLFEKICTIVEPLRVQDASADYQSLYKAIKEDYRKLVKAIDCQDAYK